MSRKTFSLSFLINPEMDLNILNQHKLQAFLTNLHFHPNKYDDLVKSLFCSLRDHLGAFQAVLLNFKNSSQAPQTA